MINKIPNCSFEYLSSDKIRGGLMKEQMENNEIMTRDEAFEESESHARVLYKIEFEKIIKRASN